MRDNEPAWVYFHDAGRVAFQRGLVELELGRPARAVELFDAARDALSATYRRDHARYAANLALAAARAGDVDRAVHVGQDALALIRDTGSVHALADLRAMRAATLAPHAATLAVREFDAAAHGLN